MTDSLPGCASSPVPENGYLYSEVSPSHSVGDVDPEEEVKLFQSKPVIPNSVSDVPPELLPFILAQCKTKVPRWNAFRDDEIGVQELCGGLTNKLYKAWVKNARADLEYDQVVIRFFGKDTDMFFERKTELIVAWTLSDNRQGVRVFGTFKEHGGGRLEAFYHGHTLHMQDLHNPALSVKIAASLAKLHTLDIPLERDEARVLKNLTKWFNIARSLNVPHINSKFSHVIFTFERLHDEISFLKRQLPKLNSPVIFCHNDLQEGNIIFDPVKDVLQVIDYEYSAYNYRGFDLANHMCEHYIDYHVDRPPFFSLDPSKHPSKEHQLVFFQAYLDTFREHLQARCDSAEPSDPCHSLLATVSEDTSESLYRETKWFMLSSNLMWGIWSIIQAVKSDIAFGYMEYAHARFSDYSRIKAEVLEEFPLAP